MRRMGGVLKRRCAEMPFKIGSPERESAKGGLSEKRAEGSKE